jgi:hypothetical protein
VTSERAGDDVIRPDLFDRTADPERWSNTAIGDKRLTWREAFENQEQELRRLRAMAQTLTDLDRCEHGRHEGDVCGGASGCDGPSKGNPIIACSPPRNVELVGRQIGFTMDRKPIVVPKRGERWKGE